MTAAVPARRIDQDDKDKQLLDQQAGVDALRNLPEPASGGRGNGFALLLDPRAFEHLQRVAKLYSASNLVPQAYRGNIADCFIAIQMSVRLGVDPFMFLQSTYVIGGRPAMMATLGIALMNERGPFRGPVQFKMDRNAAGKVIACTAYGIHKVNGERCEATVTWEMAEAEGWTKRAGSKWQSIPEQMFRYRSAMFLARVYCPEVLMGMHTDDEVEDTLRGTRYIDAQVVPSTAETQGADLAKRLGKGETVDTTTGEVKEADAASTTTEASAGQVSGEPEKPGVTASSTEGAASPAPAEPAQDAGAPPLIDQMASAMSDKHGGLDLEACKAKVFSYVKTIHKTTPDKLNEKQTADVWNAIRVAGIRPAAK